MPACVGVGRWVLRIPDCRSLKAKRSVIRGLRDRLRRRYRVSAAETGFQDDPQTTELTLSLVSSDYRLAESLLGKLDDIVCSDPRVHVVERELEVFRFGSDASVSWRNEIWPDVDSNE